MGGGEVTPNQEVGKKTGKHREEGASTEAPAAPHARTFPGSAAAASGPGDAFLSVVMCL